MTKHEHEPSMTPSIFIRTTVSPTLVALFAGVLLAGCGGDATAGDDDDGMPLENAPIVGCPGAALIGVLDDPSEDCGLDGRVPAGWEAIRTFEGANPNLANYDTTDGTPSVDVFANPDGAGRYGQQGLAGSVWEWVYDAHAPDWYAGGGNDCRDCANLVDGGPRTMRGGAWNYNAPALRGAERFAGSAGAYWLGSGIRCARD